MCKYKWRVWSLLTFFRFDWFPGAPLLNCALIGQTCWCWMNRRIIWIWRAWRHWRWPVLTFLGPLCLSATTKVFARVFWTNCGTATAHVSRVWRVGLRGTRRVWGRVSCSVMEDEGLWRLHNIDVGNWQIGTSFTWWAFCEKFHRRFFPNRTLLAFSF